jgi:hypothetical protein
MAGERNTAQGTRGDSALLPPHLRGRPADTRSRPSEPRWGHEGATKGPRGATKGPPREESLSRRGHPARGAYRWGPPAGATSLLRAASIPNRFRALSSLCCPLLWRTREGD